MKVLLNNNLTYHYCGFGLNISSEIEFPELKPAVFEKADVSLRIAPVPVIPGEKQLSPAGFEYILNDVQLFFRVKNVACYLAQNGDTIIIEPDTGLSEMRRLRLFTLATIFAGILMQRKRLPMHASAILHNGKLILICGHSGAGKSTTLAGLIKKGYTVFSDDVVVMDKDANTVASYPMIKLWEDTQDKLSHDTFDDRSFAVKPGINKYGIFFHQNFDTGSYPVKKILILKKENVSQVESKTVTASDAFNELSSQVYRPMLIHNNELRTLKFHAISALTNGSIVYKISRPMECKIESLVEYVENLLLE